MNESTRLEQKAHERLRTLYKISKLLSNVESVEKNFSEIFNVSKESFPLLTAVLIENRAADVRTCLWNAPGVTDEHLERVNYLAKEAFVLLFGDKETESTELYDGSSVSIERAGTDKAPSPTTESDMNFIVLPLIIDNLPPWGVLQVEGSGKLTEDDLAFVSAITDLLSITLDRYYKTTSIIARSEEKVTDLEIERELREVFVVLLTHDLRTPLSAAKMAAQLIQRKVDDPKISHMLAGRIIHNLERTDQMIRNLLDANLIRGGQLIPVKLEPCDLVDLMDETIQELSTLHGDRFVLISLHKVEGFWDPHYLRRIIENLCNNAIKYGAPQGPITIELLQTQDLAKIVIHNEGSPIAEKDLSTLFEQHKRSESAVKSSKKGWGLGLTLVKGVAEAHGGGVAVESDIENGTKFTVTLLKDARKKSSKK